MPISPEQQIVLEFSRREPKTRAVLDAVQREVSQSRGTFFSSNDQLLGAYRELVKKHLIQPDTKLEDALRLKRIRSQSGIVVVSVLTKPYPCPGKCLYCPTVANLPKSYVEHEPAVMRAQQNKFDPYLQTYHRLRALELTGHPISKISLRIIGGTWSYYPKAYQTWFVKRCFQACNDFGSDMKSARSQTLEQAQQANERAKCRLVEISVETRQDFINLAEIVRLRRLGVTKVEIGAQSTYDDVLRINRRGHTVAATIEATRLLKEAGFKLSYQMMLNLPGSNPRRDFAMMRRLFTDPAFRPDQLKIYPLALVESAPIYRLYQQGKFKPYTAKNLVNLLCRVKAVIPPYVRIERVIRDISSGQIIAGGAKVSNMRQLVLQEMAQRGQACRCIRCREVRLHQAGETQLIRRDYEASGGKEIFLSIESSDGKTLYSLLRLRIPAGEPALPALQGAALVRELHTYGHKVDIGKSADQATQHKGFGKKLLAEAEEIARTEFGRRRIAVISGVGAREYFGKLGYRLKDTYMVKALQLS